MTLDKLDLYYAAHDAAEYTMHYGGGTFRRDTLGTDIIGRKSGETRPADAYAVGGLIPAAVVKLLPGDVPHLYNRAVLASVIGQFRDDLAERAPDAYIGTWIDDGTVYIDAVVILPDLDSAGILARTLGERAIYNLATGETIPADDARAPRCKACDAPLNGTVRVHHHAESGKDVTR